MENQLRVSARGAGAGSGREEVAAVIGGTHEGPRVMELLCLLPAVVDARPPRAINVRESKYTRTHTSARKPGRSKCSQRCKDLIQHVTKRDAYVDRST